MRTCKNARFRNWGSGVHEPFGIDCRELYFQEAALAVAELKSKSAQFSESAFDAALGARSRFGLEHTFARSASQGNGCRFDGLRSFALVTQFKRSTRLLECTTDGCANRAIASGGDFGLASPFLCGDVIGHD
jgi:hypothetical protein